MTLAEARRLLDGIRRGTSNAPAATINLALQLTGDLPRTADDEEFLPWLQTECASDEQLEAA